MASKTPWENMRGDNSQFLSKLTKSERRLERERKIDSLDIEYNPWGWQQRLYWWTSRICSGIVLGLGLMVTWSFFSGLI